MVSLKALRTVVGITGLAAVAFLGGLYAERQIHQREEHVLNQKLAKAETSAYFSQINERLGKELIQNLAEYNKNLKKEMVLTRLGVFKENIAIYTMIHENLSDKNYDSVINDLEGCMSMELFDTEDYVISLKQRKFPSEIISPAENFFKEISGATRQYIYLSKKARENPSAVEPWYSPRLKRDK